MVVLFCLHGILHQSLPERGLEKLTAFMHGMDSIEQNVFIGSFEYISQNAFAQHGLDVVYAVFVSERQYFYIRILFVYDLGELIAGLAGHVDVEDEHIGSGGGETL